MGKSIPRYFNRNDQIGESLVIETRETDVLLRCPCQATFTLTRWQASGRFRDKRPALCPGCRPKPTYPTKDPGPETIGARLIVIAAKTFSDRDFSSGDLAAAAFQLDPGKFNFVGCGVRYPNINMVLVALCNKKAGAVFCGYISKTGRSMFKVSDKGFAFVRELQYGQGRAGVSHSGLPEVSPGDVGEHGLPPRDADNNPAAV